MKTRRDEDEEYDLRFCAKLNQFKYHPNTNPDHCLQCHYVVTQWQTDTRRERMFGGSSWDKTSDFIWAAFALQWPLIGWAMIMGKE